MSLFVLLILTLLILGTAFPCAAAEAGNRAEKAQQKMKALFADTFDPLAETDPDFVAMRDRLLYGELAFQGKLTDRQRALITLTALTTSGTLHDFARQTEAALKSGLSALEIQEILYHTTPYIGFPKVEQALRIANDVFRSQGMTLPLPSQTTVQDDERFAKGLAAQKAIFGDSIDAMHAHATEDQRPLVVQHLSAFCFGDIYTRNGLSVQDRELIVFCLLSVLGGCEPQLKGHIAGNAAVGNDRAVLLDALAQCLPYMGFPRTLNALTCINAVLPPAEKK